MIEDQFLNLFITEDIYQLPEDPLSQKEGKPVTASAQKLEEPPVVAIKKPVIHSLAIWTPPLTLKDRELISNILKAVKEDITKAHIMEGIATYHPHYDKMVCFGYQKELELKLGCEIELYKPSVVTNKKILISAAPVDLHDSKNEKGRLWKALQEMFLT